MGVTINPFGKYLGDLVFKVTLSNSNGTIAEFITYGATWHSFQIKKNDGNLIDLVVGPKNLSGHVNQYKGVPYFFGSTIGRHAGRINCNSSTSFLKNFDAKYIKGIQLHGGKEGFSRKIWSIKHINESEEPSVTFFLKSHHGEEGYLGELMAEVTYSLSSNNSIIIEYRAVSDRDTLVNLTNHTYFNLSTSPLTDDSLYIDSDKKLELDSNLLPTGKILSLAGTHYDFIEYPKLKTLNLIKTLDDIFLFKEQSMNTPKIKLHSSTSGLELQVLTDQPAVVVFAPKALSFYGVPKNKEINYNTYPAICFETQYPPHSFEHPMFPSCILGKGETYSQKTIYKINN